ncbi:Protein FRIGIDA [Apostasia shenzhenica]|uniref:FRIGIDA-like protein n=1 Tax=Apostasia shenzhenica TaxID=1088818 RepID=A0A2I0B1E3_9ASPA|nr:Protein FRIGIDA [Apostasia shenzhenica]
MPTREEFEEDMVEEMEEEEEEQEDYEEYEEEEEEEIEEEIEEEAEQKEASKEEHSPSHEQSAAADASGDGVHPTVPSLRHSVSELSRHAEPACLRSVSELQKLHGAISEFLNQWNSLNSSLDSIVASIETGFRQFDALPAEVKDDRSKLQIICETMDGRELRRYVANNLSDIDRLRRDVPEAIRRSPNPGRLVLDAMGRFYLQGSAAFENSGSLVSARRHGILVLELYLLSGCRTEDSSVNEEATMAATEWKRRIIREGGTKAASPVDALGLVLLMACFGVPSEITPKVFYHLLRLSNLKKKADVFRRSHIFVQKIPVVIKKLLSKELFVEAADLSCYFGLEDNFPPLPLISSFMEKLHAGPPKKRQGRLSPNSLKNDYLKQLYGLRSVFFFLNDHNLDATKIQGEPIGQRIAKLEEKIGEAIAEKNLKRKNDEIESYKKSHSPAKKPFASTSVGSQVIYPMTMNQPNLLAAAPPLLDSSGFGTAARSMVSNTAAGQPYSWNSMPSTGSGHSSFSYQERSDLATAPQNFYQPEASALQNLYRPEASIASRNFYRPDTSSVGRGVGYPGTSLYHFADKVIRRDSPYTDRSRSNNPPAASAYTGHH